MKNEIFNDKKVNINKLIEFGFTKNNNIYEYSTILNNDFSLRIKLKEPNILLTEITEIETGEIYTLHLTDAQGQFVGEIRKEYKNTLENIKNNCFENNIFKSAQTQEIIKYIKDKYGDNLEYLWEKFPDNAIARRKDNSKWYLAILTIKKDRLGFNSNENVEVIDLRANVDEIPKLVKQLGIYPGYHMNKKHWITIILDDSYDINEIFKKIDESYLLAAKK